MPVLSRHSGVTVKKHAAKLIGFGIALLQRRTVFLQRTFFY